MDIIVYVDSPFQLLQYFEYQSTHKKNCRVYIRLNGKKRNDSQLISLVRHLQISNFEFLKINTFSEKFFRYPKLISIFLFSDNIVFGDSRAFLFLIAKRLFAKDKFLLLDDGVATINDTINNQQYRRFTIFERHCYKPLVNQFSALRGFIDAPSRALKHVLIGSKFVDEEICSKESYLKAVEALILNVYPEKVIYIPHRGESYDVLNELKERFDFEILETKLPIEMLEYELGIRPLSLSHVLSTAVFSLSRIYGDSLSIYTYIMRPEDILSRKEAIGTLYEAVALDLNTIAVS